MFFWLLKIILYIPALFIYPIKVVGAKNIPSKGKIILAPNHQTLNDAIIIGLKIHRRRFKFMAKAPLFKNKLVAKILKSVGAYPVHTSSSDIKAVKNTLNYLKNDKALCIFPEGARLISSESNSLKNGVAMFALKTNTPIIPAYFIKKTNAFTFNKLIIGKPIYLHEINGLKDEKINKESLDLASEIISKGIHDLHK